MKNFLIIILLLGAAGYFLYNRSSTPDITAEQTDGHLVLSNEQVEWNFDLKEEWEAEGALMGVSHGDQIFDVFSGSFSLIWGETAIELAAWDYKSDLSADARGIIDQYGCAADYLNKHTINFTAIGASKDVDNALRSADEHDELVLRGCKAVVDSVSFKDNGQTLRRSGPEPVYIYVTGASVNGKEFGEI
ncbi:hypothetical protein GCAAIG_06885 [Candidatus Electronema halotolerans]